MQHPGPPRFVSVGDVLDLAPRDPDPSTTYSWALERAPDTATIDLGTAPVQQVRFEASGRYVFSLTTPADRHRLTVHCLPDSGGPTLPADSSARRSGGALDLPGDADGSPDRYGRPTAEAGAGAAGRPGLRLEGRVVDDTVIIEGHPRPHPQSEASASSLDVLFVLDDRDDLGTDAVRIDGRRLQVPVDRLPDRARIHAVAVGDCGHSVADAVAVEREGSADSGMIVRRLYDPPAWAEDAVYYEVYVRTFVPNAEGPTLRAITDRLGDLADFGIDAVWLTPVLANDHAPHGYNITDFFSVAADLGDRADLERLVERAHELGLKVLFDLVLNHSARAHPYFQDAYGNPDSEYYDWYEWQPSGEPGTYFDWEHIANFDFDSLAVRRHLLEVVDTWAPLVDGFRCDMAWAVPESFWRELRDRLKARDPEFLLLDETIPYVPDFHEGLFDVHFDSTTYATLRSVGTGWAPAEALLDAVDERSRIGFPDHARFLLYAENHDETRYLVECGRPAAMAAAGALCTLPGAPLVYAGQELGQRGRRDGIVRAWTDEGLTAHYRRLLALRRSMPALRADAALRRIDYTVRDGDPDRVVAFGRTTATGAGESLEGLAHRVADGADPEMAHAAVVVCHFGEGAVTVEPGPSLLGIDAVTGERLDESGAATVDDVLVLPTVPAELTAGTD